MEVECAGRLSLRQVSPTRPSPAASPVTEWSLWTLTGPWSREWRSSMVWCPWSRQDGPEASPDLGCSLGGGTVTSLTLTFLPDKVPALRELVILTSSALPCVRARAGS